MVSRAPVSGGYPSAHICGNSRLGARISQVTKVSLSAYGIEAKLVENSVKIFQLKWSNQNFEKQGNLEEKRIINFALLTIVSNKHQFQSSCFIMVHSAMRIIFK